MQVGPIYSCVRTGETMLPPALDSASPYFSGMYLRLGIENLIDTFKPVLHQVLGDIAIPVNGPTWLISNKTRYIPLADIRTLSNRSDQQTNLWGVDSGPVPNTLSAGVNLLAKGFAEAFPKGRVAASTIANTYGYWFDNDGGAHRIGAARAAILRHRPNYSLEAQTRIYHPAPKLLAILEHCEILVTHIPSDAQYGPHTAWLGDFLIGGPIACALEWFGQNKARHPAIAVLWRRSESFDHANREALIGRGFYRLANIIGIAG
jgi:hypothetical protein